MKRLSLVLILLLCAGLWIASCKKDSKTTGGQPITQAVAPTCSISVIMLAVVGATVGGDVPITVELGAQNNRPVDFEIFFNTGGGNQALSAAAASSISNPARALRTPGIYSFLWDSAKDIPGTALSTSIIGKVTDLVSGSFGLCATQLPVDNTPPVVNQAPTCAITAPSGTTESDDVTITYNTADAESDPIISTVEYSIATGQFKLATPAPSYVNPTLATPPGSGRVYIWRSVTDEATYRGAVTVRITVGGGTQQSTCSTNFTLDNSPPTQPFACSLTSPLQGTTVSGVVPIRFNMTGVASGIMGILEFDDGVRRTMVDGTWVVPGSSPGSSTRQWDSVARGIGVSAPVTGTIYLNLLGTGGKSAICAVRQITVDNKNPPLPLTAPTCSITSPTPGSPTQTGNVTIAYNTSDQNPGDRVDVKIEYRQSSGVYALATLLGSNPLIGTTPGSGKTSTWLSATDLSPFGPATANIRMTVTDQGGLNSTCTTSFTLSNPVGPSPNNPPLCNVVGPPAGGTYSGSVTIGYDTADTDGDPLNVTFDFNPSAGYRRATPESPYTNPRSLSAPTTALDYVWRSTATADLPGQRANVTFKVTVDDGQATAICTRAFIVDNQPAPPAVSFLHDIYPIFSARGCTGCHGTMGGLTLTGGASAVYPRIVPSRVNPSNPSASLIYAKPTGGISHAGGSSLAGTP